MSSNKNYILQNIVYVYIIALSSCTPAPKSNSIFEININIVGKINQSNLIPPNKFYYPIIAEVKNISDSTQSFLTMKCSWEKNWILENNEVTLFSKNCDGNFPLEVELKPNNIKYFIGTLYVKDSSVKINRMGFVLLKRDEVPGGRFYSLVVQQKLQDSADIFWSNKFELN